MREEFLRKGVLYTGENLMPYFLFLAKRQQEEEARIGLMTDAAVFGDARSSAMTVSSCGALVKGERDIRGGYRPGTGDMSGMTARHAVSNRSSKKKRTVALNQVVLTQALMESFVMSRRQGESSLLRSRSVLSFPKVLRKKKTRSIRTLRRRELREKEQRSENTESRT